MKNLSGIYIALVILSLVAVCAGQKTEPPSYWPTKGWRTSTPEEQGMDSERLSAAMDFLQEHREEYHINSMLIIRHGYIVADVYFYPFAPGMMHDLTSVTKSFTATLIGIAINKGYIKSVKQPVLDIFPERTVANVDANKRAMTVEDLLTMRSGFESISEDEAGAIGGGTQGEMMGSLDWVQFTLDLPMSDEPGERFNYSNPSAHLLSAIIQETTGLSSLAFAQEHLFNPLGMSAVAWPSDPHGNNWGWGDLRLTPHDMAKLGYLYLHKGLWDDQKVLSASWIAAATSIPKSVSLKEGEPAYGYLWWLLPDFYRASGRDGQMIHVIPEKDMVVVHTGGGGTKMNKWDQTLRGPMIVKELLIPYILKAVESETPLPANPNGVALLESKIQQAAAPPEAQPVLPLSDIARTVSGKTYVMDANPIGLTHSSLTFQEEKEALLRLALSIPNGDIEWNIQVGLDDVFRFSPGLLDPKQPVAAKGTWESDNSFVIDVDEIGNIRRERIKLIFEEDIITVQMEYITPRKFNITLSGRLEE